MEEDEEEEEKERKLYLHERFLWNSGKLKWKKKKIKKSQKFNLTKWEVESFALLNWSATS